MPSRRSRTRRFPVASELMMLLARHGKPGVIGSDHEKEFTSHAVLSWTSERRIEWRHVAPGKPMRNGFREIFNRSDTPCGGRPVSPNSSGNSPRKDQTRSTTAFRASASFATISAASIWSEKLGDSPFGARLSPTTTYAFGRDRGIVVPQEGTTLMFHTISNCFVNQLKFNAIDVNVSLRVSR